MAVPTPVDERGRWVRRNIDEAFAQVLACAGADDLVVIKSTVPVGTARSLAIAGSKVGREPRIAACPDRSLTGTSFRDQFVIPHVIGGVTEPAAKMAARIFERLGPVNVVRSAEAAELLKLLANVLRDVTFALANQFALICEELNVDFDELVKAASDRYPRFQVADPGHVGGPCLPKDTYLLAESVSGRRDLVALPLCARQINLAAVKSWSGIICDQVKSLPHQAPIVAVLGMAFKGRPPTRDQRSSMGHHLVAQLRRQFPAAIIRTWDPEQDNNPDTVLATVENADIVVMANNHFRILGLEPAKLASIMRSGGTIFDLSGTRRKATDHLPCAVSFRCLGNGGLARRGAHSHDQSGTAAQ